MLLKKWLLGSVLAAVLVGASACGDSQDGADASKQESKAAQEKKADGADEGGAQADLDGVPEVVAEVNGEEIGKDEFVQAYEAQFQQMAQQSQMSGQEVDQDSLKKQVVESLVSTELLVQEADERKLAVSDAEVDKKLEALAQQNGLGSSDAFLEALEKQGMDQDEVQTQVEVQLKVEQLVEAEAGDLQPTEKETRALYAQMSAQQKQAGGKQAQEMPSYKQVRPQLEEQLKSQEMSSVAQKLVGDLREAGDVTINL